MTSLVATGGTSAFGSSGGASSGGRGTLATGGQTIEPYDRDAGFALGIQYCDLAVQASEQLNCPGYSQQDAKANCAASQAYTYGCTKEAQDLLDCIRQQTASPWTCGPYNYAELQPSVCTAQVANFNTCSNRTCCGSLACCP